MGDARDEFIQRAIRFRKLLSPVQVEALRNQAVGSGRSLWDLIRESGLLDEETWAELEEMWARSRDHFGSRPTPARVEEQPTTPARAASAEEKAEEPPPLDIDPERVARATTLADFLGLTRDLGASDLHITVGAPPVVRVHGRLVPLPRQALAPEDTERLLLEVLNDEQRVRLMDRLSLDFCCTIEGQGRYRSCIVKQRLGWDGAFRVIANRVPSFEELGLRPDLVRLTEYRQGLVLITGPRGCGKSTTLAAMVETINQSRDEHIITIEDPIEYEFEPKRCQITQREVGTHTESFASALRAALREDPDVIVIGELRDQETISLALRAAETGHLVFGTLHTTSAARTIDRLLDVFPPEEESQVRSMVSESLRGIVCQQLLPRKNGRGLVLAAEIVFNTPAVANLIRERKLFQLPSVLLTGVKQGMQAMDVALLDLVQRGEVAGRDAWYAAEDKKRFAQWAPGGGIGKGREEA